MASTLRYLRWSLLRLTLGSLAGVGLALIVLNERDASEATSQRATMEKRSLDAQLARMAEERADVDRMIGRYRELDARGMIGAERRLDWVEAIRRSSERRKLFAIKYELGAQRLVASSGQAQDMEFMASPMKFEMPLLHENDLLNLLADLAAGAPARLRLKRCSLERSRDPESEREPAAQLQARCEADWITIMEKK